MLIGVKHQALTSSLTAAGKTSKIIHQTLNLAKLQLNIVKNITISAKLPQRNHLSGAGMAITAGKGHYTKMLHFRPPHGSIMALLQGR